MSPPYFVLDELASAAARSSVSRFDLHRIRICEDFDLFRSDSVYFFSRAPALQVLQAAVCERSIRAWGIPLRARLAA